MVALSLAATAVSAVMPSILVLLYFHRRDAYPEPPRVVLTTFALGVAVTLPALLLALPGELATDRLVHPLAYGLANAFLAAAIPEELLKFLVLWGYSLRHRAYDEAMDGIVYGVAAALGFATLENVLYVAGGGLEVAITRALTAIPGHAAFGAVMGALVSRARWAPAPRPAIGWALVLPIVLHGLYDFPLLAIARADSQGAVGGDVLSVLVLAPAVLIASVAWSVRTVRHTRRLQMAGGPPAAVSAAVLLPAGDRPSRRVAGWLMLAVGGLAASGGGLLTLTVLVGVTVFGYEPEELASLLAGTAALGVLPLVLGLALFLAGIRRLNRQGRERRQNGAAGENWDGSSGSGGGAAPSGRGGGGVGGG